jgi:hypothetical protein
MDSIDETLELGLEFDRIIKMNNEEIYDLWRNRKI